MKTQPTCMTGFRPVINAREGRMLGHPQPSRWSRVRPATGWITFTIEVIADHLTAASASPMPELNDSMEWSDKRMTTDSRRVVLDPQCRGRRVGVCSWTGSGAVYEFADGEPTVTIPSEENCSDGVG